MAAILIFECGAPFRWLKSPLKRLVTGNQGERRHLPDQIVAGIANVRGHCSRVVELIGVRVLVRRGSAESHAPVQRNRRPSAL